MKQQQQHETIMYEMNAFMLLSHIHNNIVQHYAKINMHLKYAYTGV